MVYHMRLHAGPFAQIKAGSKNIEVRLNDPKRQLLRVGDRIEFISRQDSKDIIMVEVTALPRFASFQELFKAFSPHEYGAGSVDEYEKMYEHYAKDDEEKYGVIAIKFKLSAS